MGRSVLFNPAADITDLSGKVILVTGGNAGLGAATVRELAAHNPACIYICARTPSKAEAFAAEIQQRYPEANLKCLRLDLANLESVKTCAAEFNEQSDRLDLLFLNAGIGASRPGLTRDGYEIHFGTNHFGHALFTQLLMPKLISTTQKAAADVRIIVVSSISGQTFSPKTGLTLGKVKTDMADFGSVTRYGHSKLANILFARKLSQLYPCITTTSLSPGAVKSEIWSKSDSGMLLNMLFVPFVWVMGVTTDEGVKNQLWCATAEEVESGKYYDPVGKEVKGSKHAVDQRLADELWEWTSRELANHGGAGWPMA